MPCLLVGTVSACATRSPGTALQVAPVASSIIWRVEEGDVITTRVFRNPELGSQPTVGRDGSAFFPGLGRVPVVGMTLDSLEVLLSTRYGSLVREPAVQVTMQRDITLYGQIRAPGVYAADPGMTLQALLAKAGGHANANGTLTVTLETSDGRRLSLPREVRLGTVELHKSDAVQFIEESFFLRNAASIQATQVLVSTITTLISLILIATR